MKKSLYFTLVVFTIIFGRGSFAATTAVKWPSGNELKILNGHLFYEGLKHEVLTTQANQCHKKILAQVQRELLSTRASCQNGAKGKKFELIVNGKREPVDVCLIAEPKYQRTLERMISCSQ